MEFESSTPLDWRPGDLLLISPAEDQPDRCYSIGSTPRADDRHLLLTVALRQSVAKDGTRSSCGGQATLGQALDDALRQVAKAGGKSLPEVAVATVGRWRAEGRIRCDLID